MSFLEEVDTLKARIGITKPKTPIVIGIAIIVILVLGFCGYQAWNVLTTPELSIEHSTSSNVEESNEADQAQLSSIFVHITGEVKAPGLYELPQGARLSEAVNAAGGFTDNANDSSVNLARVLSDGEQVSVASKNSSNINTGDVDSSVSEISPNSSNSAPNKININTASAEELMTLDGIGEATAEKIITYRQEQGSFKSIDEIKEVSGIGDKKYEAIKDFITV